MRTSSTQPMKTQRRAPPLRARKVRFTKTPDQLKYTVKIMGEAARNGSHYLPIIKHAQRLASRAAPKDFLGQARQIYDDLVKRWRYVFDPTNLELVHVSGPALYGEVLGMNRRDPREHGAGDCDDIAGLSLAMLSAIGLPVVIKTISPPRETGALFSHTYGKVKIPKMGWLSFDPVGHPDHGFGWEPPHGREATWDLNGNLLGYTGRFPKSFGRMFKGTHGTESTTLQGGIEVQHQFRDYGLGAYTSDSSHVPLDWAKYGVKGFGAYASQMGIIDGEATDLLMEHDDDDMIHYQGIGLVRTKMMELSPVDWELVRRYGAPRMGSVALGDDGSIYQYQRMSPGSQLGFFKKIFSAVKKGVKWVGSKAKQLISKLPGGKYLVRLYDKVHKVSMKLVKPLARLVGKAAGPLSKVAAFIPGYGPALVVGLKKAGEIAKVFEETGVKRDKSGKPKFKSDKQAKRFKKKLKAAADKLKRKKRRKKKEKKQEKRQRLKRELKQKIEAKLRKEYAARGGAVAPPGRLIKAGTPEHVAYFEGLGFSMDIED